MRDELVIAVTILYRAEEARMTAVTAVTVVPTMPTTMTITMPAEPRVVTYSMAHVAQ